ncbi:unnamed protein product [Choristocarpus tenellus]
MESTGIPPCVALSQMVFNDLWSIDLPVTKGSQWRELPVTHEFPPPRIGHSAVAMGDRIILFGGRDFSTDRFSLGVRYFDVKLGEFTPSKLSSKMPVQRRAWSARKSTGHSAVVCEEGLIIFGGLTPSGKSSSLTWLLDVVGSGEKDD